MKQSFGKTLMSCFLTVTLMASVIAGAISVSLNHAKAQSTGTTGVGYFDDLWSEIVEYGYLTDQAYSNFYDFVTPFLENTNYCVFVFHKENTDYWSISLFQSSNQQFNTFFRSGWGSGITANYNQGSLTLVGSFQQYNGSASYNTRLLIQQAAFYETDTTTVFQNLNKVYPNLGIYNDSSIQFWCSHVIGTNSYWPDERWNVSTPNLLPGSDVPPTIEFDLVKFKLGERTYLTTRDQNIIFNTQPLDDDYLWWTVFFENEDETDFDHLILEYKDLTLIPGADLWLNVGLQNVHSQGVLALDITDYTSVWYDVWKSDFYWIIENPETEDPSLYVAYASAVNVPFVIVDQPNGQPDSYTQAFNEFNTYVTNYNTNHVIPENLAQTLFGVEGGKLYPVTVSEPSSVAATRNDGALVDGNLYTFHWSMTEPNNLGYNYDLFDVVIIPSNYAGYYGLVYFYDSSLNPPYQFVDRVSFDSLLDSFDCIIILPDDSGTLEDNTWWQQLVPASMRGDMAVGGTSSMGIEYVDTVSGNEFQGFMIVTQKAIQKQQLWNFNDGISKLYKLEVDYIDSEDKWKDSFLLWSASIFDMLNSLDGRLGSILNSLTSLSTLVDQIRITLNDIAADPDPDEVKPWYLSLWLFMKQFEPSNAQISEGLGYLVDNIDDIPLLPALTPVPALPTPGGG